MKKYNKKKYGYEDARIDIEKKWNFAPDIVEDEKYYYFFETTKELEIFVTN